MNEKLKIWIKTLSNLFLSLIALCLFFILGVICRYAITANKIEQIMIFLIIGMICVVVLYSYVTIKKRQKKGVEMDNENNKKGA